MPRAACRAPAHVRTAFAEEAARALRVGAHDRLLLSLAASSRADEAAEAACECVGSSVPSADAEAA